jgi:hypothetical protein
MSAHPWLKFYPRDWRGDQALRAVSIAARGLWIEMLCIMHEASPYGHLILAGRAVSNDVLARVSGLGVDECGPLLSELENAGVLSRTRKGVIYSRRMVKDNSRAEKGRKSVAKRWGQGVEKTLEKPAPNRSPNRVPITQKPEAREKTKETLVKKLLPDDWQPKPFGIEAESRKIVDAWPPGEAKRQVEAFKAHHRGNGNRWKDWQDAWQTWVLNSVKFGRLRPSAEPTNYLDHLIGARTAEAGR